MIDLEDGPSETYYRMEWLYLVWWVRYNSERGRHSHDPGRTEEILRHD